MALFTGFFIFGYILPSVISLVSYIFFATKYSEKEDDDDIIVGAFSCVVPVLNIAIAIISLAEWGAFLSGPPTK